VVGGGETNLSHFSLGHGVRRDKRKGFSLKTPVHQALQNQRRGRVENGIYPVSLVFPFKGLRKLLKYGRKRQYMHE